MSQYDVVSICNALVDILVEAEDKDIDALGLTKGVMHLVDQSRQDEVLEHFHGKSTTKELGGSSLNAIRTIASLGLKTSFAGMIGDDAYGRLITERMTELNIQQGLKTSSDSTGTCLILVTPDGERTMNTNLGASRLFDDSLLPSEAIKNSKIFHFCGYQWDTDGQIAAIEAACKLAKAQGVKISFDVADPFVIGRHKEAFLGVISEFADIVFANKEEAKMLFDKDPEGAARQIAESSAIAVVKKGGEGAIIVDGETLIEIDPVKTNVVDTTAAGDMFAAGFLYGLAGGKSLKTCGSLGAVLASDVISRTGATVSEKALEEAKKMFNS